jgi:ATP-dependent Clp protease ATP-binding subunit ClpB
MSEYVEPESISRLIGSPPGYVGYEQGGQLTEKVKYQPYSVVLLDEMEKAHPRVLNLVLQIADAGRLTDGQGPTVNFKNTIVILTTNVGSSLCLDPRISGDFGLLKEKTTEMLISATSPELVNRMDAVVVFRPLSLDQVHQIIELQTSYLGQRLEDKQIGLSISHDALSYLARKGYDPAMGARPAKRVIQNEVESPLSEMILGGGLREGDEAVVGVSGDELLLTVNKGNASGNA